MSFSTLRYSRIGTPIQATDNLASVASSYDDLGQPLRSSTELHPSSLPTPAKRYPPPTFLQRAYLRGILHKPKDLVFIIKFFAHTIWTMLRLHCIELPYLIATRFRYSTKNHPIGWTWFMTVAMGLIRSAGPLLQTPGQIRFLGHFIEGSLPIQSLFLRNVKIEKSVSFKVHLEKLLGPERATLATLRRLLRDNGVSDDPLNPSMEYLRTMHPHAGVANMPEEVGHLDTDGSYRLKAEWIEALADPKKPDMRPKSKTVILYFHGGGHAFLSPASHRSFLSRLARDVGPGTRVFSVDYRMAPENPFPAAIHDAYAAYLYLTEPNHVALSLDKNTSATHHVPVDPRDIVVGGDSAGANLAAAFMLYMVQYIKPSMEPKYVLPHATLLLSIWGDVTSSLPAASSLDGYCYCPGPIGNSPFDKKAFLEYDKLSIGANYVIGDVHTVPNARNALGDDHRWLWYQHLAQHPLVSPVHRANLTGVTNTIIHTGTHDRLLDDNRLYAHRLGLANPDTITRIEVYKYMVHVHHVMAIFPDAHLATLNLARFIARSKHLQEQQALHGISLRDADAVAEQIQNENRATFGGDFKKEKKIRNSRIDNIPLFLRPDMVRNKTADDVEWVTIEQDGQEFPKDEGWSLDMLKKTWPPVELHED
ncbi:hypothetical protein BG004_007369 [Podila humilis]|nr:hypothetical protein BG004_007369 [Podila humilis]